MSSWADKKERGSAWLIHLIVWLARSAGRPLCRALLHPIVLYFFFTDPMARRASAEFLGAATGRRARWGDVYRHIYSFAATLLDRVYMAAGEFERFNVTIIGQSLVEEALSHGRGCLLLGSHLGSFDLLMLAHRAMPHRPRVCVMMRVDERSRVRRIAGIKDKDLDIIEIGRPDSYLRAHEALESGAVVGVLADRVEGASHLPVEFLGRRTAMPVAPHVLAARRQTPVLACFGLYEGGNRYRIEFVEFGAASSKQARGVELQPVVARYAGLLEAYARKYPLNWFNFFPYWDGPGGAS